VKIELFTYVYNDEDMIPFFLKYYEPIVDKMTFIDSDSTDNTLKLLKNHEVVQTGITWWDWDAYHVIKNNIWRKSEYDLVFFPDLDEFLYRKNLREFLETRGCDMYQMEGFQMVSNSFPEKGTDMLENNKGFPLPLHDKFSIFDPKLDFKFDTAHTISTTSTKKYKTSVREIKLLHYKYLGVKNMLRRAEVIRYRVPLDSYTVGIKGNILAKFPTFVRSELEYKDEIKQMLKKCVKVV
jgi:hypothetical protein